MMSWTNSLNEGGVGVCPSIPSEARLFNIYPNLFSDYSNDHKVSFAVTSLKIKV
jgi:hypothetical protein